MARFKKELKPSVWVFQHDGIRFEFTSLDAAIAYVRGFKSGWGKAAPIRLFDFCFVNDIVGATAREYVYGKIASRSEKRI